MKKHTRPVIRLRLFPLVRKAFHPFLAHSGFIRALLVIALPVALQNLLINFLGLIDTIMIGRLGTAEIAAVGLANQLFFISLLFFFGIGSGSAVFIAQYWGKKDIPSIRQTMGLALLLAETGAVITGSLSIFAPEWVLSRFTTDAVVIAEGASYLRIVGFSYFFTGASFLYSIVLRSTEEAKLPLKGTIMAVILNTALNYIFIFGKLGFPAMGVPGAALATLIARGAELIYLVSMIYRQKNAAAARFSELFSFDLGFLRKFFKTTLPVMMNELAWASGMVMYKVVFARMGTEVIAAINITETVLSLTWVVFMGTGSACAVLIGNKIGKGDYETAFTYARRFMKLAGILGLFAGLTLAGSAPFIPLLFRVSDTVRLYAGQVLLVNGFIFFIKALNLHMVVGIFRSGGDTTFGMFMDVSGVWFIGVPLALIGGLYLGLPVYLLYLLISIEEIYKCIIGLLRLKSKKWLHDVTQT